VRKKVDRSNREANIQREFALSTQVEMVDAKNAEETDEDSCSGLAFFGGALRQGPWQIHGRILARERVPDKNPLGRYSTERAALKTFFGIGFLHFTTSV
jgi:hypothetical protein